MMANILIVEDEQKLANILKDYLLQTGYQVTILNDGMNVINCVKSQPFDLILLDLMLPGKDGLTVCQELREFSKIPIIMVTARVEEIDRLLGLEVGADDYICKPFSPREVVARVKAVLRRSTLTESSPEVIKLNFEKLEATVFQHQIELTAIEFNILNVLFRSPGRIYSRNQLIEMVYNDHRVVSERTIDSHIKKLRKKLNQIDSEKELVQSVYSVGYKLVLT
ncbi:MAG: response regulator [Alteromonadales bacterium]|nr:response regulator [Alteromonadales bacterium]